MASSAYRKFSGVRSWNPKPLKGQNKGFYAFRMNDQYRARLIKLDEQTYFILVVGDFH